MNTVNYNQPAFLFTVGGVSFYEHPTLGDEHPLLAKHNGKFINTDFYDRPDQYEAEDFKASLDQ